MLNSSGAISIGGATTGQSINLELLRAATATTNLNESEVRTLAGVLSGTLALSTFYGKSNRTKGLWLAGLNGVGSPLSEIDGITYSTESAINPAATLSAPRSMGAGFSGLGVGYIAGGSTSVSGTADIEAITFATETVSNPTADLSVVRDNPAGTYSAAKGYAVGGALHNTFTYVGEIDGIIFSTQAATNPAVTIATARSHLGGVQSSDAAFFGGGVTYDVALNATRYATLEGMTFSTESALNPAITLSLARDSLGTVSSSTRGYFGGGVSNGGWSTTLDGVQFATTTAFTLGATLSAQREGLSGVCNSTKGYFGGGYFSTVLSEIDGLNFSTETAINPSATLAVARLGPTGV